ncbi:hypothetical protein M758_4G049200 [Ceratodon purpureus]|uniref:Uncharacterized protein n=1 Tax=Ceratodon purpureus TaxID=3225 RepID=A0A8T0I774_CERPU|nr:hypothetical protein KC19_4G052100 [Ceratodon purpureus]KAG0618253.1 hypothetical protein M758_4G049200 [Ceratodon purpureus]
MSQLSSECATWSANRCKFRHGLNWEGSASECGAGEVDLRIRHGLVIAGGGPSGRRCFLFAEDSCLSGSLIKSTYGWGAPDLWS